MDKQFGYIFWSDDYRELTTDPADRECADRNAAILLLYDKIAASVSNIVYLNEIYDNAPVELQDDNMKEITVRDKYALRNVYARPQDDDTKAAGELTLETNDNGPVGIIYTKKKRQWRSPDFQHALNELNRTLARKSFAQGEYFHSLMDQVNDRKIVAFDRSRRPHDRG